MKIILQLFFLFTVSITVNAQISFEKNEIKTVTVGEIAPVGSFIAKISYMIEGDEIKVIDEEEDLTFILTYRNYEYQKIVDIQAIDFISTFNQLQELRKNIQTMNQGDKVNINLGQNKVVLERIKYMGMAYFRFNISGQGYFLVNPKQIDRLFGG